MHKKFNLLAHIFKYVVIQNDTGSDITVIVSATGNHKVIDSSESQEGIALGGVQDEEQTITHFSA